MSDSISPDSSSDSLVYEVLRSFYRTYGMPGEGPPDHGDLTVLDSLPVDEADITSLRNAIDDNALRRKHRECHDLVEQVADAMISDAFLRELAHSGPFPDAQFEHLVSGVLWFSLVAAMDRRDPNGLQASPLPDLDLPLPVRVRLTVHGSLVLRLYLALV
jgi:hypothetical protein